MPSSRDPLFQRPPRCVQAEAIARSQSSHSIRLWLSLGRLHRCFPLQLRAPGDQGRDRDLVPEPHLVQAGRGVGVSSLLSQSGKSPRAGSTLEARMNDSRGFLCILYPVVTPSEHPAGPAGSLWSWSAPPLRPDVGATLHAQGTREGGELGAGLPCFGGGALKAQGPPPAPSPPAPSPPRRGGSPAPAARSQAARSRPSALRLAPSRPRPRAGGGLAARAGRGSGASRALGTFAAGAAPGPERAPPPPPLPRGWARGGGGGCGRRRPSRRPPAPPGK
jgi:hypothetical protein